MAARGEEETKNNREDGARVLITAGKRKRERVKGRERRKAEERKIK